jgi:hypothetical protein
MQRLYRSGIAAYPACPYIADAHPQDGVDLEYTLHHPDEVAALARQSYRHFALKRMLKTVDSTPRVEAGEDVK